MKAGEIWKSKNGIEKLIASDPICFEEGDELVKIDHIRIEMGYEGVVFSHMQSGALGVLNREEFLQEYEKVYE